MKLSLKNVLVGVFSLFVIISGFFYFSSLPVANNVNPLLQDVRLLVATTAGSQLLELGSEEFEKKFSDIDGEVIDYVTASGSEAVIVNADSSHRVLARLPGEEWRVISETANQKATLELSNDGNTLGFSERIEGEKEATDISAWQIVIQSLDTDSVETMGGYSPQFVTVDEHWTLVYFSSPSGVAMYEPVSKEIMYLSDITAPSTEVPIQISADGTKLIAFNAILQDFIVFDLQDPTTISLSAVGTIPLYNDVYIQNGTLFGLDVREDSSSVWKHAITDLAEGDRVYVVPENINPLKFVFSLR